MKVCIISPYSPHKYFDSSIEGSPSPTLAHLGAHVEQAGHEVILIDSKFEGLDHDRVMERVRQFAPQVVGLSTTTSDVIPSAALARSVKELNKSIVTVVGGVHPTVLPEETLNYEQAIDIAVIGEGEETFIELLAAIEHDSSYHDIDGLAFRDDGKITLTAPRKPIDTTNTPVPAWHLLPKGKMYYVQVSRGCPGRCSFCCNMFGKRIRATSPARLVEEIEAIQAYAQPEQIILGAATFGVPRSHSMELLDAIIESGLHKRIKWLTQTRIDVPDIELFRKMKEAGCTAVGLGIEAGDDYILEKTGKNITVDQIRSCVASVKEAGLDTIGYFVFGHPYETRETAKRTSDFAVELNPSLITMGIMTPWPGTEVFEMARRGEGRYILADVPIEGMNKHFGERALLFKDVSVSYLQWLKLRTYLLLYLKNGRYMDGIKFILRYHVEGFRFIFETLKSVVK